MLEERSEAVSWKTTILKILVVLLFPIGIERRFSSFSFLFSILFRVSEDWDGTIITIAAPLTVLIAVIMMLPGIYFDRKVKSTPIASSIRRKAIVTTLITWLIPYGLVFSFTFVPIDLFAYAIDPIMAIPILSLSFFIILPILNREFMLRRTPENMQMTSLSRLFRSYKRQFGKKRFLPLIIWTGLLVSPLLSFGPWGVALQSIFYQMQASSGGAILEDILTFLTFMYSVQPIVYLHSIVLIFSLRFVFARDIFRFSDGKVTQSRLISLGILAEVAPVAIMTLFQLVIYLPLAIPFGYFPLIVPTPIFPILGYIYVRKSRVPPRSEFLWDDEEHRMWYEEDRPSTGPDSQPIELHIKVPISYLIRSKFRRRRNP